ncbi:toxin-antitoxin system TumE family protein [Komagataeibacter rhaeticus]|uniref:toxin-antitoxin system TumE family protein n=1 Tax=Komagataeibacter rhaeticus TaxID=215221 RepID=UPI001CD66F56|nr:DUF6516 family protein [Komagataeibacter rhaeticus]
MTAELLFRERSALTPSSFVEIVVWHVPVPVRGSAHRFKYRLAFVADGACVIRYDNEAGKGDHKHIAENEVPYRFFGIEELLADFWKDVETWRERQ